MNKDELIELLRSTVYEGSRFHSTITEPSTSVDFGTVLQGYLQLKASENIERGLNAIASALIVNEYSVEEVTG